MSLRAVAIGLKIPDNEAYTALTALRRLGITVDRVERTEIYHFEDDDSPAALVARIKSDESIFNPNKHRLTLLDAAAPRPGEVWIKPRTSPPELVEGRQGARRTAVAWRLFDAGGSPAAPDALASAVDLLLCNPAIELAVYQAAML